MASPHFSTTGVVRLSSGRQKQDATTTGESLTVLIEAVEQHAQENDVDPEPLLDLLTRQREELWDLCKLLGTMRARDDRLQKLHAGLIVLQELWLEAEGGS
jgi:K+/H+ antiporter YhaU regulatory subunit KhtT